MCNSTVPTVCILGEPENSSCTEILDSKVKYSLGLKREKKKSAAEGRMAACGCYLSPLQGTGQPVTAVFVWEHRVPVTGSVPLLSVLVGTP